MTAFTQCSHMLDSNRRIVRNSGICPVCKTDLDHEYFQRRMEYIENKLNEAIEKIRILELKKEVNIMEFRKAQSKYLDSLQRKDSK